MVTYTLILNNTGAASDPQVIMTDTLPAGVAFGEWRSARGALRTGSAITWTGVLTAGPLTLTFTASHTGRTPTSSPTRPVERTCR